MDSFLIPTRLEDLAETTSGSSFYVENAWDPSEYGDASIEERIEEVAQLPVVDDCLCLSQSATDTIYSLAVAFPSLSSAMRELFLDTLQDLAGKVLQLAADTKGQSQSLSQQAKNNTKAVLYLLSAVSVRVEASLKGEGTTAAAGAAAKTGEDESDDEEDGAPKKGKKAPKAKPPKGSKKAQGSAFAWADYRAALLELMLRSAEMEPSTLWAMGLGELGLGLGLGPSAWCPMGLGQRGESAQ